MKQIMSDIRQGILCAYYKYIALIALMIFLLCQYIERYNKLVKHGIITDANSLVNTILHVFAGMEEYIPQSGTAFEIPVIFFIVNLFLAILIGDYPMRDLKGFGMNVLIRSDKRRQWWLGKCVWNSLTCVAFYACIYITILLSVLFCGDIKAGWSADIAQYINNIDISNSDYAAITVAMIVLPICMSLAVSMLQMTCSLILGPVIAYIVVIVIYVFSAFYMSPYLIGNYCMMLRNSSVIADGITLQQGIVGALTVYITFAILGLYIFEKKDII